MVSHTFNHWNIFLLIILTIIFINPVTWHYLPAQEHNSNTSTRTITFAGCDWNVRSGYWGPGPNHFSDSAESVWVDDQGRLPLKIRQVGATWYCAEVYSTQFTTYGEHRFLVDSRIDLLDRNIVLGLFTYSNDASEIDIEFSRWGDPNYAQVGSFTVQPWTTAGNCERFICHLDSAKSTHYFNWQPDSVTFASMHGHYLGDPPAPNHYIHRWTYQGKDTPRNSNNLRTHINYWLNRGDRPLDIRTLEVIITHVVQPLSQSVPNDDQPPRQFNLLQNYPNPFDQMTRIPFLADVGQQVQLKIYDLLGKLIFASTLTPSGAMTNVFQWDGSDESGKKVASGVYFYQLDGIEKSETKKLIYLNRAKNNN